MSVPYRRQSDSDRDYYHRVNDSQKIYNELRSKIMNSGYYAYNFNSIVETMNTIYDEGKKFINHKNFSLMQNGSHYNSTTYEEELKRYNAFRTNILSIKTALDASINELDEVIAQHRAAKEEVGFYLFR